MIIRREPPAAQTELAEALAAAIDEEDPGTEIASYVRYLATAWRVSLSAEGSGREDGDRVNRYSISMPEEPRLLGVAPATGEAAVVFVAWERLEIWRAEDWLTHVRSVARDEAQIRQRLKRLL